MDTNEVSLFEFNPDSGEIDYIPTEEELQGIGEESGGDVSNQISSVDSETGSELSGSSVLPEEPGSDDPVSGDSGFISSLDAVSEQQLVQALLASSPASGSLSSSTLDYFDRLVSGLPSDFAYVAYRNDSDDSYAGTIIYGKDYDVSGNTIMFGEGAKSVDVSRYSGSGYQNYISYDTSDASNTPVTVSDSGTILYYTNAVEGYPVLGGYERPVEFSAILIVGLIVAFASCILSQLLHKRG